MKQCVAVTVVLCLAIADTMFGQSAKDIKWRTGHSAFDLYCDELHLAIRMIKAYARQYSDSGLSNRWTEQTYSSLVRLEYKALSTVRQRFYEYGLNNEHKIAPDERAVWQRLRDMYAKRVFPSTTEEMSLMSPSAILKAVEKEKDSFIAVMTEFDPDIKRRFEKDFAPNYPRSEQPTDNASLPYVLSQGQELPQVDSSAIPENPERKVKTNVYEIVAACATFVIIGLVMFFLIRKQT